MVLKPKGSDTSPRTHTNHSQLRHLRYLEEGEVAVPIDAGDLQVTHDDFAVLVELLQGAVLLVQVGQSAQLVLRTGAHYTKTKRKRERQYVELEYDDTHNGIQFLLGFSLAP